MFFTDPTRELHERAQAAFLAAHLEPAADQAELALSAVSGFIQTQQIQYPCASVWVNLFKIAEQLIVSELQTLVPTPPPDTKDKIELARYRDATRRQLAKLEDPRNTETIIKTTVIATLSSFVKYLPPPAQGTYEQLASDDEYDREHTATVPLLDLYSDVRPLVSLLRTYYVRDEQKSYFTEVRERLIQNFVNAATPTKVVHPRDHKGSSREIVHEYLRNTPLADLFNIEVPFSLPEETKFAGHWIIAPPGRGKTTLLQHLFLEDATRAASIIVLDSKGELINPIRKLAGIADRLVIIEPDEDHPLALNPLDIPKSNVAHTISLLEYIFSALLDAKMTSLQSTLFRYVLPAIVETIPNPTLLTFRDIIENGFEKYRAHFERLKPLDRQFFEKQFDSKTYADTRHQLIWRLDFLLTNPLIRAMFEAPRTKIDIGKEMDAGKIILINNSKDRLTEEGSEFFGRFFISLVLSAAQQRSSRRAEDKLPCFFYIDECQSVIKRDPKIATILDECRSQKIGLILAHQRTEQIKDKDVLSALFNCAIRYANSDDEARPLADNFRTTPELLRGMPKGTFAAFVRDLTPHAMALKIPYTDISALPQSTAEQQVAMRQRMHTQYGSVPQSPVSPPPAHPPTAAPPPSDGQSGSTPTPARPEKPPSAPDGSEAGTTW